MNHRNLKQELFREPQQNGQPESPVAEILGNLLGGAVMVALTFQAVRTGLLDIGKVFIAAIVLILAVLIFVVVHSIAEWLLGKRLTAMLMLAISAVLFFVAAKREQVTAYLIFFGFSAYTAQYSKGILANSGDTLTKKLAIEAAKLFLTLAVFAALLLGFSYYIRAHPPRDWPFEWLHYLHMTEKPLNIAKKVSLASACVMMALYVVLRARNTTQPSFDAAWKLSARMQAYVGQVALFCAFLTSVSFVADPWLVGGVLTPFSKEKAEADNAYRDLVWHIRLNLLSRIVREQESVAYLSLPPHIKTALMEEASLISANGGRLTYYLNRGPGFHMTTTELLFDFSGPTRPVDNWRSAVDAEADRLREDFPISPLPPGATAQATLGAEKDAEGLQDSDAPGFMNPLDVKMLNRALGMAVDKITILDSFAEAYPIFSKILMLPVDSIKERAVEWANHKSDQIARFRLSHPHAELGGLVRSALTERPHLPPPVITEWAVSDIESIEHAAIRKRRAASSTLNFDLTIAIQEERRKARRLLAIRRTAAENASRTIPVDPLQERHTELIAADSPDPSHVNLENLNAERNRALQAAETLLHDYPNIYEPAARSTIGEAESKRILDKHPDLHRGSSGDIPHQTGKGKHLKSHPHPGR